jgi:hypothetical protein
MTMLQSYDNNLFTSIFVDRPDYASSIIKLLLVLESEGLIPLFELDNLVQGICAYVIDSDNKITPVKDIILQFGQKVNPLTLFFGSHFQIELKEKLPNNISRTLTFNSYLIFTKEGLILEYPELTDYSAHNGFAINGNLERTSLVFWEEWQEVAIEFSQEKPECTLIFTNRQGSYLKINQRVQNQSEVQQIEQQLPLVFCYFVMKNFWKYITKFHNCSFSLFNPDDFLYLDRDRLTYLQEHILSEINITEDDLTNLVKKINVQ